jgi:hypothetical protein
MAPTKSRRPASRRTGADGVASGSGSGSGSHTQAHASGSSSAAGAFDAHSEGPRRLLERGSARVPAFADAPGGTGWQPGEEEEAAAAADEDAEWGEWEYEEHEHVVLLDLGPAVEKLVKSSAEYSISVSGAGGRGAAQQRHGGVGGRAQSTLAKTRRRACMPRLPHRQAHAGSLSATGPRDGHALSDHRHLDVRRRMGRGAGLRDSAVRHAQ